MGTTQQRQNRQQAGGQGPCQGVHGGPTHPGVLEPSGIFSGRPLGAAPEGAQPLSFPSRPGGSPLKVLRAPTTERTVTGRDGATTHFPGVHGPYCGRFCRGCVASRAQSRKIEPRGGGGGQTDPGDTNISALSGIYTS